MPRGFPLDPTWRERWKIRRLVLMVLDRRRLLAVKHPDRQQIATDMQAIGWALEQIGYPPSRYDEVLQRFAPPRHISSPDRCRE